MTDQPDLIPHSLTMETRREGEVILGSALQVGEVAKNTGQWLHKWASEAPDRVALAERSGDGWRDLTYADLLAQVRAVAASLLENGTRPGDRIVVLSGPSIDHGILTMAAQYIGAATVPLAEQYSLIPEARGRLDYATGLTRPAMVYAADGQKFADALERSCFDGLQKIVSRNVPDGHTPFESLLGGAGTSALDEAHVAVGPDTLAKILFTSGSTSDPKGVPQTHGMMCVNQAMYQTCLPLLSHRPPVMLDWLPWNHVFASNSNYNMILANGGTLVLDDGKPLKGLYERTLENIALRPGTISCNVPAAYGLLVGAMRDDPHLRRRFFEDLDMIFYAGASLPADVWNALEQMAREETGRVPLMTSCWGMTETAPAAIFHYQGGASTGMVGVPMPGVEARLLQDQPGRYELRVRGPNVMSGYLDDPEKTQAAFDDEGFFITGDAVRFADPDDPAQGLLFDGRIAEEFKLQTGIWVHASTLRLQALAALSGLVQDVVVTGDGRTEVGLLIFPAPGSVESEASGVVAKGVAEEIAGRLSVLAEKATGSSIRIARALVMAEPPSIGAGEITVKGNLNAGVVLDRRRDLLDRLYTDDDAAVLRF